jgi:hypothetical protein
MVPDLRRDGRRVAVEKLALRNVSTNIGFAFRVGQRPENAINPRGGQRQQQTATHLQKVLEDNPGSARLIQAPFVLVIPPGHCRGNGL